MSKFSSPKMDPAMRKFIQVLGIISLIAIAAVIGAVGMVVYSGQKLDSESKAFVDVAITTMARNWDEKTLIDRASPELLQSADADQMKSLFQMFATLGHLIVYQGSAGDANIAIMNGSSSITARYTANAQFENGTAVFKVGLVIREGERHELPFTWRGSVSRVELGTALVEADLRDSADLASHTSPRSPISDHSVSDQPQRLSTHCGAQ